MNAQNPPPVRRSHKRTVAIVLGSLFIIAAGIVEISLIEKITKFYRPGPLDPWLAVWTIILMLTAPLFLLYVLWPAKFKQLASKRLIRRVLILAAWIFTLVALFHGVENWRGRSAWNKQKQALEAQGVELNYAAFIPKAVPDDQNFAATPFVQSWITNTEGNGEKIWKDGFDAASDFVAQQNRRERQFEDLVAWEMALEHAAAGQKPPYEKYRSTAFDITSRSNAAPKVLKGLEASNAHFEELRAASQRPFSRYPIVYDLDEPWAILVRHAHNINRACVRLELKASAELALGKSGEAFDDIHLMFYLGETLKDEPLLISFVVRMGSATRAADVVWEGLAEHRWSNDQLKALQELLRQRDFVAETKRALEAEHAFGIMIPDLLRKRGLGLLASLTDSGSPDAFFPNTIGPLIPRGWYHQEQLTYSKYFADMLEGAYDPVHKRIFPSRTKSNSDDLYKKFGHAGFYRLFISHDLLAMLLLPSLKRVLERSANSQIVMDQALIACGLERHRLAKGEFPEKLESLNAEFVGKLPHDPLTGESYKYRRTPDNAFVLYSVGWNETDDGGVAGEKQWDTKKGDVVWTYPTAP